MEKQPGEIKPQEQDINLEGDTWEIPSNYQIISLVTDKFEERIRASGWSEEDGFLREGFQEALTNAIVHGNLGVGKDIGGAVRSDVLKKAQEESSARPERFVHVAMKEISPSRIEVVITDEGEGFDPDAVADPRKPENIEKSAGRGILIMRAGFDTVDFENGGRTVRLIKEKKGSGQ